MTNLTIVDVINRGAAAPSAQTPALCGCPDCGVKPAINPSFFGQFCIYCGNDDCPCVDGDGWPQAMGKTLAESAAKWNAL